MYTAVTHQIGKTYGKPYTLQPQQAHRYVYSINIIHIHGAAWSKRDKYTMKQKIMSEKKPVNGIDILVCGYKHVHILYSMSQSALFRLVALNSSSNVNDEKCAQTHARLLVERLTLCVRSHSIVVYSIYVVVAVVVFVFSILSHTIYITKKFQYFFSSSFFFLCTF